MAAVVASAVYCYEQLPHDPYRKLKEQAGDAVNGQRLAEGRRWAGKEPTPHELRVAFSNLDEQLKKNPYNVVALSEEVHLGLDYAPEVAAAACDRVLQRSPKNYFALVHGARAYLALTNLNRAIYYAAKAVQVQDCPEARSLFGDVLYAEGNTNAARKQYNAALSMNSQDEVARLRLKELQNPH
jgi:tetratricopeptide (TPR) repeat protein